MAKTTTIKSGFNSPVKGVVVNANNYEMKNGVLVKKTKTSSPKKSK